jgi:DNA-binding transcriptional MerR regulator
MAQQRDNRMDLTTRGVAERLRAEGIRGGSRPTIIRWADEGSLPHYRSFGGGYRYFRPEVIDLLVRLWRGGATNIGEVKEQLFELHDKLAERDKYASEAQDQTAQG